MPEDLSSIAESLLKDLHRYLGYLREEYGYRITLHNIEGVSCIHWPQLLTYNYHLCAVCCEIKSSSTAWRHCIERQPKVMKKAAEAPYIGTCYAGVTEAVFPLWDVHNACVGFLCVSGFTADRSMSRKRAAVAAQRYGLPPEKLCAAAEKLSDQIPPLKNLSAQIAPVQTMLRLLFYLDNELEENEYSNAREKLYHDILRMANSSFREPDFCLRDVCARFSISYSYASHLFAEFHRVSFARYVRSIRIEAAKRYLEHTTLPILFTATECGFSDSNYFSSVFKKETGLTPSQWRTQHTRREES